jgi:DNA-binding winged helix-turn-helix (wHTH) protein/transposase
LILWRCGPSYADFSFLWKTADSYRFKGNDVVDFEIESEKQRVPKQAYDDNVENLPQAALINPSAHAVADERFASSSFFDPSDIVQVKYEMLRRVAIDGVSVQDATVAFGFSRQTFYHAKADFEQSGLAGLLPFKRGPKESHKLTNEVLEFIQESRKNNPSLRIPELTRRVKERFQIEIHQQSIRRALRCIAKGRHELGQTRPTTFFSDHLEIDLVSRKVRARQKNIHLTPTEFSLLRHLLTHADKPVPHRELMGWVWRRNSMGDIQRLRVYVSQLRKKIEPDPSKPRYILTEPWIGYRFAASI